MHAIKVYVLWKYSVLLVAFSTRAFTRMKRLRDTNNQMNSVIVLSFFKDSRHHNKYPCIFHLKLKPEILQSVIIYASGRASKQILSVSCLFLQFQVIACIQDVLCNTFDFSLYFNNPRCENDRQKNCANERKCDNKTCGKSSRKCTSWNSEVIKRNPFSLFKENPQIITMFARCTLLHWCLNAIIKTQIQNYAV